MDAIKSEIISSMYAPEILIPVYPEINTNIFFTQTTPIFLLVYRFYGEASDGKYLYTFSGGRA